MKYKDFNTSEFVEDPDFRKWVQKPDEMSNLFWNGFLQSHPHKFREISNAKNLLLEIEKQVRSDFSTRSNEDLVFQRIQQEIAVGRKQPVYLLRSWPVWAAAASIIFVIGFWFMNRGEVSPLLSYEGNIRQAEIPLSEKVNDTNKPILVTLQDGSSVFLKPKSKISYSSSFNSGNKREVYLSGEAFFEVTKNPARPFYVYANELVTKVLGTSFNVQAFENDKNVTVKVSTGRVSVALASDIEKTEGSDQLGGVVLLANQQAVLSRLDVKLVKSLIEDPGLIGPDHKPVDGRFVFGATPAAEVFQVLENAYGIDIEFDNTSFANCQFTANLTEESLYEKLDIICKSIEATYKVYDSQIVINGKGCN